jgi:hypothetical protein
MCCKFAYMKYTFTFITALIVYSIFQIIEYYQKINISFFQGAFTYWVIDLSIRNYDKIFKKKI